MNQKFYLVTGILTILLLTGAGCINNTETSDTSNTTTTPVPIPQQQEENPDEENETVPEETPKEETFTPTVEPTQVTPESQPKKSEPKPVVQKPIPVEPTPTPEPPKPEVVTCNSFTCLAELAKTCTKGELVYSYSIPFPFLPELGLTLHGKTYYKVNGTDQNGSCTMIQKHLSGKVTLSEEGRQEALDRGQSEEEIDAELEAMNKAYNDPVLTKSVTTCTGTSSNLATYLINSEQGNFGSVSCSGSQCTNEPNITCTTSMP